VDLRSPALARHGLLLLWLWIPTLMLVFKRGLFHYYFDILYPAPFIAAALLLAGVIASVRHARARSWARGAVFALLCLLVIVQVHSLRRWWALTIARGAMPIPGALVRWSPSIPPDGDLMPMRYKQRIVASLLQTVGHDRDVFYRRVHGSAFDDVLQDKGLFFDWLSRRPRPAGPVASSPSRHVAVLHPGLLGQGPNVPLSERVGPFSIVGYTPLIDYGSWEYLDAGTAPPGPSAERTWRPLRLPTRSLPDPATFGYPPLTGWSGMPLLIRGSIRAREPAGSLTLVVSIMDRGEGAHHVDHCRLEDTRVVPRSALRYFTLVALHSEAAFDLSSQLRAGPNVVTCQITGRGTEFDVDVYEIPGR
jgi:hypothetical protein